MESNEKGELVKEKQISLNIKKREYNFNWYILIQETYATKQ